MQSVFHWGTSIPKPKRIGGPRSHGACGSVRHICHFLRMLSLLTSELSTDLKHSVESLISSATRQGPRVDDVQ